jgi:hypothetical protein
VRFRLDDHEPPVICFDRALRVAGLT